MFTSNNTGDYEEKLNNFEDSLICRHLCRNLVSRALYTSASSSYEKKMEEAELQKKGKENEKMDEEKGIGGREMSK